MRTPPIGFASTKAWARFNEWADAHHFEEHEEDWLPWWECFFEGVALGVRLSEEEDGA